MTEKEFQRIKEAEKERLRSLKRLKEALRVLKRRQRMQEALGRMTDEPNRLLDRTSTLIQELSAEAALNEARVEIAMDELREQTAPEATSPETASSDTAASNKGTPTDVEWEEEQRAARADELLSQIRQSMGLNPAPAQPPDTARTDGRSEPEATLGEDEDGAPLPEKTIGRMRD